MYVIRPWLSKGNIQRHPKVWHESELSQQTLSDAQMLLTIPQGTSCRSNTSLSLFFVHFELLGNAEVAVHSSRTRAMTRALTAEEMEIETCTARFPPRNIPEVVGDILHGQKDTYPNSSRVMETLMPLGVWVVYRLMSDC